MDALAAGHAAGMHTHGCTRAFFSPPPLTRSNEVTHPRNRLTQEQYVTLSLYLTRREPFESLDDGLAKCSSYLGTTVSETNLKKACQYAKRTFRIMCPEPVPEPEPTIMFAKESQEDHALDELLGKLNAADDNIDTLRDKLHRQQETINALSDRLDTLEQRAQAWRYYHAQRSPQGEEVPNGSDEPATEAVG